MIDHRDQTENGERFIRDEMIGPILGTALGEDIRHPICKQFATTHAAGSAVVGLAARTIQVDLRQLKNLANACHGELIHEYAFTPKNLAGYISILSTVKSLVDRLVTVNGSPQINLSTQILTKLPPDSLITYHNSLSEIRNTLANEIEDMSQLLLEIEKSGQGHWEERIESLLKKQVSVKLASVCDQLEKVERSLYSIAKHIKEDWNKDVTYIEQGRLCRFTNNINQIDGQTS